MHCNCLGFYFRFKEIIFKLFYIKEVPTLILFPANNSNIRHLINSENVYHKNIKFQMFVLKMILQSFMTVMIISKKCFSSFLLPVDPSSSSGWPYNLGCHIKGSSSVIQAGIFPANCNCQRILAKE